MSGILSVSMQNFLHSSKSEVRKIIFTDLISKGTFLQCPFKFLYEVKSNDT